MEQLQASLQSLIDKSEIRELVQLFCRAADRKDIELMRSLYHEGATDDHGAFFSGLASEFFEQLPAIQQSMLILHHNITSHIIALDGDRAEGEVYVIAFHQVKTESGPMDLLIGGRYLDRYERKSGQWKFSHRSVLADWVHSNEPSLVNLDHPLVKGSHIGEGGPDDPSYRLLAMMPRGSWPVNA